MTARMLPLWVWVLLAGFSVVGGVSCAADYLLPPAPKSWERAVWSTSQFIVGVTGLLAAGVWASVVLGRYNHHFSLMDLLLPDRLWPLAVRHLPATRWQVCLGAWSITAIICAVVWVGGWTYWFPTHKPVRSTGDPTKSPFGPPAAKEEDPDGPDAAPPKPSTDPSATDEPTEFTLVRRVIVGYTAKDGQLTGVVTAEVLGDEMRYAGVIPLGDDPALKEDLLTRFAALKADAPVFPDVNVRAVWLRPQLNCEVATFPPAPGDAAPKEPQFKGLVFPKEPQPVRLTPPGDGGPVPPATPAPAPADKPPAPKGPAPAKGG
jgi:hypothetical protein